jgi:hypothetical protein
VSVFSYIRNITPFKVVIRDETQCWVTGKGPVKLVLADDEEITISEVYYSESFGRTCLLSVPQLAKKGAEIRFKSDKVQVLDGKHLVATGTLCKRSGLYKLDQKTRHIYRATISASGKEMVDWHRRFGHTNYRYIRKTAACVKGLSLQGRDPATCESCLIGKSTIAHMPSVDAKEGVLDLLYMDHWGLSRVKSLLGNKLYLLLADESGFRSIQFTADRKSYFKHLQEFVALAETQTGKKVRAIRLNNAPEYRSKELRE